MVGKAKNKTNNTMLGEGENVSGAGTSTGTAVPEGAASTGSTGATASIDHQPPVHLDPGQGHSDVITNSVKVFIVRIFSPF